MDLADIKRRLSLTPPNSYRDAIDQELVGEVERLTGLPTCAEPAGARDVYWCWIVNEPFIISYADDGVPRCAACGWTDMDCQNYKTAQVPTLSQNFLGSHTFVVHVHKPR